MGKWKNKVSVLERKLDKARKKKQDLLHKSAMKPGDERLENQYLDQCDVVTKLEQDLSEAQRLAMSEDD